MTEEGESDKLEAHLALNLYSQYFVGTDSKLVASMLSLGYNPDMKRWFREKD